MGFKLVYMELKRTIVEIYPLPESSYNILLQKIESLSLNKGKILLDASIPLKYVYFIKKGLVRSFIKDKVRDITLWFGIETDIIVSMHGLSIHSPVVETIEVLEHSEFYIISIDELLLLASEDIHISNWCRHLVEKQLCKFEKRLVHTEMKSANEKYSMLIKNMPDILQRAKLSHIASYLGITQVSLSRIRSKISSFLIFLFFFGFEATDYNETEKKNHCKQPIEVSGC